jgi:hypothetical protein
MRTKFEAVDKNGKLHKRATVSRFYSHCVVIHFAAGHRNPRGEAVVMPFPNVRSHELASCFNCEADLAVTGGSRAATRPGRATGIACSSSTTLLTLPDDDFTKP